MISNDDLLSWILPPGGGGLSPQKLRKDIKVEKYPDRKTINPPNIIFTPGYGYSVKIRNLPYHSELSK